MPAARQSRSRTGISASRIRETRPERIVALARRARGDFVLPLFLVLALLLGGGGSPAPLPEMLLEWTALAALLAALWLARPGDGALPPSAVAFAAALLGLPALQLVPLPPALWTTLPGREAIVAALALVDETTRWMPWSISPPRTLAALLALIVPVAALLLAARAGPRARTAALATVAAMALAAALFGAAQLAAGEGTALRPYGSEHAGYLTGFHANRNAAADGLLIGLLALAALFVLRGPTGPARGSGWRLPWAAAAAVLAGAVLLTGSRAGIALLVALGIATAAWLGLARRTTARPDRSRVALWTGGAALVLAAATWIVAASPVAGRIAARFGGASLGGGSEPRPDLWVDTLYAVGRYWPFGSGLGTFVPAFVAAERLEVIDPGHPNRAHNDFLELALEAGLPGLVLLAALGGWLAWRLVRRLREATELRERIELGFAGATLALLAAHSVVDYPLRSMALAALGGLAVGLILAPGSVPAATDRHRPRGDEAE